MIDALRRRPIAALMILLALAVGVWTAIDHEIESDRKAQGYELCEDAIRADLLPGYHPTIDVTFYEINPDGDYLYDALADDGDGDWGCNVAWVHGKADVTTHDGTYRASDLHYNSD